MLNIVIWWTYGSFIQCFFPFFNQFLLGDFDFSLSELMGLDVIVILDLNFPVARVLNRHWKYQTFSNSIIIAIRTYSHRINILASQVPVSQMINHRISSWKYTTSFFDTNDFSSSFLDLSKELIFNPLRIIDFGNSILAVDCASSDVGILGGWMISPNHCSFDLTYMATCFDSDLCLSSVLV